MCRFPRHWTAGVALLALLSVFAPACAQEPATLLERMNEHLQSGRYSEALTVAHQHVDLVARQRGSESKEHGQALYQLGNLLGNLQRYMEAEAHLRRARDILGRTAPGSTELMQTELVLASSLVNLSKLDEGFEMMRRAAEGLASRLGPSDPLAITALNNLANTLQVTGRPYEAEPILMRLIAAVDLKGPSAAHLLGNLLANLASLLVQTDRPAEGLQAMRLSVEAFRKMGDADNPALAIALNNLGQIETDPGAAEKLYREAMGIAARALGRDSHAFAIAQLNLANLLGDSGRPQEAEPEARAAALVLEKTLGPEHPKTGTAHALSAMLLSARGAWREALEVYRRVAIIASRNARVAGLEEGRQLDRTFGFNAASFPAHLRAIQRIDPNHLSLREEAFAALQRHQASRTAVAIAKMAIRAAAPNSELGQLARAEQDLLRERSLADQAIVAALAETTSEERRRELRTSLTDIDRRLAEATAQLRQRFPGYADLSNPEPVTLRAFQQLLQPDEALVTFVEVEGNALLRGETHVWVVTRESIEWKVLELEATQLSTDVSALRCGLDTEAWARPKSPDTCRQLLGTGVTVRGLPFDLARAHALYRRLLGPVEASLRRPDGGWRQLLVVATGALTVLPLATLVTEPPATAIPESAADYVQAKWLGVRQPITMLPSIGSLKALRELSKASRATRPFLGFGNPLLQGEVGSHDALADAARRNDRCREQSGPARGPGPRVATAAAAPLLRSGQADPDVLRTSLAPLPETADELCAVARFLGAAADDVHLAGRAIEERVKQLSASGLLADARIVHFATHGLLASEAQAAGGAESEPALVLTPPDTASATDDGLLTAAEIANLKLDADWVILSACNTAADEAGGLEAFSGLARAFFYAGARALLVSHWPVDSTATVDLVTRVFTELAGEPSMSRAEAHRRGMATMIARGGRHAHPTTWAPFVIVGDGGAIPR